MAGSAEFLRSIRDTLGITGPTGEQFIGDGSDLFYSNGEVEHGIAIAPKLSFPGSASFSPDGLQIALPSDRGKILVADLKKLDEHLQAMKLKIK